MGEVSRTEYAKYRAVCRCSMRISRDQRSDLCSLKASNARSAIRALFWPLLEQGPGVLSEELT